MRFRSTIAVIVLCAGAVGMTPARPTCDVSGDRLPRTFTDRVCKLVAKVHRNDMLLYLHFTNPDLAITMRARTVQAENWLLTTHAEFKRVTSNKVATTYVYYGRVKLATAQTNWLGEDKVQWGG